MSATTRTTTTDLAASRTLFFVALATFFALWPSLKLQATTPAERTKASQELAELFGSRPEIYTMGTVLTAVPEIKTVERLLREGADPNYRGGYVESPMTLAASEGYLEILALFCKRRVDVDIADAGGYNALMRAIIGNQLGAVQILLKAGAKIQYRTKAGSTMMMLAAGAEDMRESFGRTDLGNRDFRIARLLIEHGASMNDRGDHNATLLMIAVTNKQSALVKFLVRSGVDLEAKDENGFTALAVAADRNLPGMIELLKNAGADIEARNNFSETPLTLAARVGALEAARTLVGLGATIDPEVTTIALSQLKDHKYRTDPYPWYDPPTHDVPTHIRATVKYLIEHGAPKPSPQLAKYLNIRASRRAGSEAEAYDAPDS
jgi:ankyrin repeat protein